MEVVQICINCLNFSSSVCSARFQIMSIRSWFVCSNLPWKLVMYMFLLTKESQEKQLPIFNLENINFPSCSGGSISLHHSITLSLPVRHLEIQGGGGISHMKRQGILVGKFESNSYGRLMWTLPELHYTPKRYRLKRDRFDYQLQFKRGSHGHLQRLQT